MSEDSEQGGRYISVSKEGVINIWNIEMNMIRSITVRDPILTIKHIWWV